jgi:thiol-disulfide isomerase/thioredoxin
MLIQNILSYEDFESYLKRYKNIVVNISATWCKPCMQIKPQIEKFVSVIDNSQIIYLKLDNAIYDEFPEFNNYFNIKKIPYFALISEKKIIDSFISGDFIYVSKKIYEFQRLSGELVSNAEQLDLSKVVGLYDRLKQNSSNFKIDNDF